MHIYLIEASDRLLKSMSENSSITAAQYVKNLGVTVILNRFVKDYDGDIVYLSDGTSFRTHTMIWAAGIKGNSIEGLNGKSLTQGNRLLVDPFNRIDGYSDIFAIGDLSYMPLQKFPNGHPQVAQVAIQQARNLGRNLISMQKEKPLKPFDYRDFGSLATIGRNRAVVDLKYIRFHGLMAWFFWMFIHLMAIVGVKNRILIFVNWAYYYFTYDQSLRLIIKPKIKEVLQ
jgi:NADH dehydrogenase